mgnify:CR=1 FL=1
MTALIVPWSIDDPVNQAILAVSEDRLQGFQRDPLRAIARQSGIDVDLVQERIRAMLRRPRGPSAGALPEGPPAQRFGELAIDHAGHAVTLAGAALALTTIEYALLTTLAAHPGRVFTRDQLLEQVWGGDYFGDDHVVDVHITNLRKKLADSPAAPRYIETVRGVGYRFAGKVG